MNDKAVLENLINGCESEQLHLSGAIQSFGAMLRIDAETLTVTHASANLKEFVDVAVDDILGRSINETNWLSSHSFLRLPEQPGKTLALTRVMENETGRIDALLIRGKGCIIVEVERNNIPAEPIAIHQYQRPLMVPPHDLDELEEYHQVLLQAFHAVTGFDRVMIYRFKEDWSGEVVAESTAPEMGSYLGLNFPASDIPAIARNLYMINPARMIPDTRAPVIPVIGLGIDLPDLTWSDLRSVSPVHLQYLANMGVAASFSVPIRVAGKLWGLVACHHQRPIALSPDQRNVCVALSNAYALGLTSHLASRRLQMLDSLERRIDRVLEAISEFKDPLDGIETNGQVLMAAMAAQGFAMALRSDVVIAGDGPDLDGLAEIDDWFLNECKASIFHTDHLVDIFPEQHAVLLVASGMMAVKARSQRSGWVRFYWFRPAEPQEMVWAGNPNKPVVENAGAIALSPRRSFERWVETKTDYSRAWSNEERMIASKFRNNLLRWL
jgi:light-regulated signal transduction histidine kinase (bacteriophytochrome)